MVEGEQVIDENTYYKSICYMILDNNNKIKVVIVNKKRQMNIS